MWWYEKWQNPVKKTEIKFGGQCFANLKVPSTAIRQQPLQLVLTLRSCTTMDLIYIHTNPHLSMNGLWSYKTSSSMSACHAVGLNSIPGWDKFPGWGFFFGGFFLTCKTKYVRKLYAHKVSKSHLAIIFITNHHSYGCQWPELLTRP